MDADLVSCEDYRSDAKTTIGHATYNGLSEGDLHVIFTIIILLQGPKYSYIQ